MRKIYVLLFSLLVGGSVLGQDIQFAQFYASALYLNPAFAGSDHHNRIMMHQRVQWPKIDGKYNTTMFAYDRYFEQYQSGFGVMIIQDFQGSNDLRTTDLSLQYSYELHVDETHSLRFGMQLGYLARSVGYGLVFPQNLQTTGINVLNPPSARVLRKGMADISSGLLFYNKNYYISASAHHLNTPNTDFTIAGIPDIDGVNPATGQQNGLLPIKYALVGGYRIPLPRETGMGAYSHLNKPKAYAITPTFHYKSQGKSDQLDLGLYGIFDQLLVGVWYRGIPLKRWRLVEFDYPSLPDPGLRIPQDPENPISGLHNNESFVGVVGWIYNGIDISYSYDFIVSKLKIANTFGAHEINITFVPHHYSKVPKIKKFLPCPVPMGGRGPVERR